jgi:hypothetical protein
MSYIFEYRVRLSDGSERSGTVLLSEQLTMEEAQDSDSVGEEIREAVGGDYTLLELRMPKCDGCRGNQPNQLAHMDYGGCLADAEE